MDKHIKVAITNNQWGICYDGLGRSGRQYSIHRHKSYFTAFLISGEGQPISATGRSPLEALQRAELLQEKGSKESEGDPVFTHGYD